MSSFGRAYTLVRQTGLELGVFSFTTPVAAVMMLNQHQVRHPKLSDLVLSDGLFIEAAEPPDTCEATVNVISKALKNFYNIYLNFFQFSLHELNSVWILKQIKKKRLNCDFLSYLFAAQNLHAM